MPTLVKEMLSKPEQRIELYDFVDGEYEALSSKIAEEEFPVGAQWNADEFASRLDRYWELNTSLMEVMASVGYWGTSDHKVLAKIPLRRLSSVLQSSNGLQVWNSLKWYSLVLHFYSLGIGSVAADNYGILKVFLDECYSDKFNPAMKTPISMAISSGFASAREAFKELPDRSKQFVPFSEYAFSKFGDSITRILGLGNDYEDIFDRYEILFALLYADEEAKARDGRVWGPIGRFGWKFSRSHGDSNPYVRILEEASIAKDDWPPLLAGCFSGSYERFREISGEYQKLLSTLHW